MQLTLSPTPPCSFWETQPFQTGQSGPPSPHQCLLSIHSKGPMLEDKRVAFLILAALNWAMQVQSVIPLDPAARSHRPFSMSGLLPNLAKNRWVSTHKLSVILSFTGGLKAHKLWEQLCSGLQRATLCLTYPPCLCAFLEATGEGGSNNSLALESVGPDIAQCNQHPICQLEKKKKNNSEDTWHSQKGDVELFLHIRLLMIYTGRAQKP